MNLPDSALSKEARGILRRVAPPEILNHSVRIYLLGRAYAQRKNIDYDEEGLYLAALFHDLGLCPAYKNGSRPFQINGSHALQEFLVERHVPPERIPPLVEAIDFHMQLFPRWSKGNVAGLLQVGAWMDITKLRRWVVKDQVRAIEAEYPRLHLNRRFPRLVLDSIGGLHSCLGLLFPASFAGEPEVKERV